MSVGRLSALTPVEPPPPRQPRISGGRVALVAVVWLACTATAAPAADWYVSPTGSAGSAGTLVDPWDLQSALVNRSAVGPGDNIWVLGGTYRHPNRSMGGHGYGIDLAGAAGQPITVRNYDGQRAVIDGGLNTDSGDPRHLRIWGLEVISGEAMQLARQALDGLRRTNYPGSNRIDLPGPRGGVNLIFGHDIKLINNVLHDGYGGFGFWGRVSGGSELHGNIVYDTGWVGPDRYHGHGIYTQNYTTGGIHGDRKFITDNLLLENYCTPMKTYGSDVAYVENYLVANNICRTRASSTDKYVLIGGQRPSTIDPIEIRENLVYDGDLRIGYRDGGDDMRVYANTVVGGDIGYMQFTNLDTGDPDENRARNRYLNTVGFEPGRYAPGPLSGQGDASETSQDIPETATTSNTWTGTPGPDSPQVVARGDGNQVVELDASARTGETTRDVINGLGNDSGVNRDGFGSFVLNVAQLSAAPQRFIYHQRDGGGDPRLSIGIRPDPVHPGKYNVGVDDYWLFTEPTFAGAALTPGDDVVVVYQYVYDGWWEGDIRMWVDPAEGDQAAPDVELNEELLDSQQEVRLLQEGGQYVLSVDGMLFGEVWEDVWHDGGGLPRPIITLQPNDYEPGRANLAVIQLGNGADSVAVDFSGLYGPGQRFRLVDPKDFWGEPVLQARYEGAEIDIPVAGRDFSAFVVLPGWVIDPGDFDDSGAVDAGDIDDLLDEIAAATNDAHYDLTGDDVVDQADADELVRGILGTEHGDANLDGAVDVLDLSVLGNNYSSSSRGWTEADFNGDGMVDVFDLTVLANNYGATRGGSRVPEPATLVLLAAAGVGLLRRRQAR